MGCGGAGLTEWRRLARTSEARDGEDEDASGNLLFVDGETGAGAPGWTLEAQLLMAARERRRAWRAWDAPSWVEYISWAGGWARKA